MKKVVLAALLALLATSVVFAGESYTATATGKVDGKEQKVTATITIERYSTQAEKDEAKAAFDKGGTTGLAAKLNTMPAVGKLKFEDGREFDLKLANQLEVVGGRFVTVLTAKPIRFIGAEKAGAKPVDGYDVAVIDLDLKAGGKSEGTAAPAAKVKIGDKGGFQVEDYGSKTICPHNPRWGGGAPARAARVGPPPVKINPGGAAAPPVCPSRHERRAFSTGSGPACTARPPPRRCTTPASA